LDLKNIKQLVKENAPDGKVTKVDVEGPKIILYTDDLMFFIDNNNEVRKLATLLKKRIIIRPNAGEMTEPEKAREIVREIIPEEAEITGIEFDEDFREIYIEAEKLGLVIGKRGSTLDEITKRTGWIPKLLRKPPIVSETIRGTRKILFESGAERQKILRSVGKKIYRKPDAECDWIRVMPLGGAREVGRSCVLLQTPESNVLIDCGINVAASDSNRYPDFRASKIAIDKLDAVIVSHAHLDHCLAPNAPVTMADGSRKPINDISIGDEVKSINWKTGKIENAKCVGKKEVSEDRILEIKTPYHRIEASPDHRFFVVENMDVKEIRADDLEEGMIIPSRHVANTKRDVLSLEHPIYNERVELNDGAKLFLRDVRKEKHLSQLRASQLAGMGVNFVSDLENRYSHVGLGNLNSVLDTYGLNNDEFISDFSIDKTRFPESLDEDLAQIIGYLYGDGHASSDFSLRFTDKSIPCLERYKALFKEVFKIESIIRHHPDKGKNAYVLEVNNAGIKRFFEINFPGIYKAGGKYIPKEIFRSSLEIVSSFLRGIADAEGCVTESSNSISISSGNEKTRRDIRTLLSMCGIPSTIDSKYRKVNISSSLGIRRFRREIDFSHPQKKKRLEMLYRRVSKRGDRTEEIVPVFSKDMKRILNDAGMLGRVHGSPNYKELPSCVVDWFRRGENSYATTKSIEALIDVLESRLGEMEKMRDKPLWEIRRFLSVTRSHLAKENGVSEIQVQWREEKLLRDEIYDGLLGFILKKLDKNILTTEENIKKLQTISQLDLNWEVIKKIEEKPNPYKKLVDIRVEPNHNFIANDLVVHNCGFVPYLYKYGYEGPVYCTEPTRDLMTLLQLDAVEVGERENRKLPYSSTEVRKTIKHAITLDYEEVADITPDMRLTLYNAGHILGSSVVHLHIGEGLHNLVYTGDLKFGDTRLLEAANFEFPRVETLIMESTYGGRYDIQPRRRDSENDLIQTIENTIKKKGKVLVPVFSVGRSQEVMMVLENYSRYEGLDIPIYIDGMIWEATAIHTSNPEYLKGNIKRRIFNGQNPFLMDNFERVKPKERQSIIESEDPCVILATSGMMTGGPSVEYFKNLAGDPNNVLTFVGYQAEGSLGRRLQNGLNELPIEKNGRVTNLKVNINVKTIDGFSGHADRRQLLGYSKKIAPKPKRALIMHGESKKCMNLAMTLYEMFGFEASAPQNLDAVRLV